jgi:hypothetical protein
MPIQSLYSQAQCDGREGRESSYGKRRKRRQIRNNGVEKDEDFSLKEMFRVFENRDEIATGRVFVLSLLKSCFTRL